MLLDDTDSIARGLLNSSSIVGDKEISLAIVLLNRSIFPIIAFKRERVAYLVVNKMLNPLKCSPDNPSIFSENIKL